MLVLTFIAFLRRPPPQLIVSNNPWPHHDPGHGVARREGGGENSGRNVDGANSALPLLLQRSGIGAGVAGALPSLC